MLYQIVDKNVVPEPLTKQELILAKHMFGGYQLIDIDNSMSTVEGLAIMLSLNIEWRIKDVLLVNIGDEEKEEQFLENCMKRGARPVFGVKPNELLLSEGWDLMEDVIAFSKETPSNDEERLYAQEALMEIVGETSLRVERDEIDYGIKMVIDEMARRVLWRIMRQ